MRDSCLLWFNKKRSLCINIQKGQTSKQTNPKRQHQIKKNKIKQTTKTKRTRKSRSVILDAKLEAAASSGAHAFPYSNSSCLLRENRRDIGTNIATLTGWCMPRVGGGELQHGTDGHACREFLNYPLKETIWASLKLFVTPKGDQCERANFDP